MNFFTSSSDAHRRYVLWLASLALIPTFFLFVLGVFLEPLYGDLTRIGSHSERSFGWSVPQLEFSKPLYTEKKYDRYHDIVVLGDSFSIEWPNHQWQNHLVAASQWSVLTMNAKAIKLDALLRSRVFLETPPAVFVLESVERELPRRISDGLLCDTSATIGALTSNLTPNLPHASSVGSGMARPVERKKDWNDVKLGFVLNFLRNNVSRIFWGVDSTEVKKVKLDRPAPFSSIEKQELLVYIDDFRSADTWRTNGLQQMGCRIERIRKQVEANGRTQFVLMIAPNKLSAYGSFFSGQGVDKSSLLSALAVQHPAVIPRIDLALNAGISNGDVDVYLPDDTHWGSSGHQIVAHSLREFLQKEK